MPLHSVVIHQDGPALWPGHKPLEEVLQLKRETLDHIFESLYQGNPSPPGGSVFRRAWWSRAAGTRYDHADRGLVHSCVARYISVDTALKAGAEHDRAAAVVGELWPDYRLAVRLVRADRLEFPDLQEWIEALAIHGNRDDKLRGIIVEDKAAGTSALQTLAKSGPAWLRGLLIPFVPTTDKTTRANQAARWCKLGCIMLPGPSMDLHWLPDFEDEIFNFPQWTHDDMVDAFSQLILWLENVLQAGYEARGGGVTDDL